MHLSYLLSSAVIIHFEAFLGSFGRSFMQSGFSHLSFPLSLSSLPSPLPELATASRTSAKQVEKLSELSAVIISPRQSPNLSSFLDFLKHLAICLLSSLFSL